MHLSPSARAINLKTGYAVTFVRVLLLNIPRRNLRGGYTTSGSQLLSLAECMCAVRGTGFPGQR